MRALLALTFALFVGQALAQTPVQSPGPGPVPGLPLSGGNASASWVAPTNGASNHTLGNLGALLNPSPFASTDVGVKPYGNAQIVSSYNLSSGTRYVTLEVPSDFTAVKLRFANIATTAWAIQSVSVAASSQYAVPGGAAGTGMFGVSAFNSAGTDITATSGTFQIASFGLNGADGAWIQNPSDFTNIAASTTATSCSGSVLNVASATGIANGQTAVPTNPVTASNGPTLYHVSGAPSGTAITLDAAVSCASGDSWVFLPITVSVPAATNPTIPNIISTDPVRTPSVARIDGPVISGETPFLDGASTPLVAGMTANVVGSTSVSLTGGAIPAALGTGQIVRFCSAVTTSAPITPTNTIPLSSATGVAAGMVATLNATAPGSPSTSYNTSFSSVVSAVAGNNVTTTDMIDGSISGTWAAATMIFSSSTPTGNPQFTVNGTPAQGSTSVTLNDPGSNLANWQAAISAGVTVKATSTNIQAVSTTVGITVSAINSGTGVITLASGTAGALLNGQPVILYMQRTTSGTITPAYSISMSAAPANNMLPGSEIVGTGWKANTHISLPTASTTWITLNFDKSPTQTIASGSSVWMCHQPMKLSQAVAAGATSLPFLQTNYPNRLLLVRIDVSGANPPSTYNLPGTDWGAAVNYGLLPFVAGGCNPAFDGVLSPSLLINTSGGCSAQLISPVYAVQLETPIPVVSIMAVGDSKFQGATTPYNSTNFINLASADLSTPALPISQINCGWSGAPGALFTPVAKQCLSLTKPGIVVIEGIANNWPSTAQGYGQALSSSEGIAAMAGAQGSLVVMTDGYPGASFGLDTLGTINSYQVAGRAFLSQFAASGRPYFDTTSIVGSTFGNNIYLNAAYSGEGLHLLLAGHQALMGPFETLIFPYVQQP